MKQFRIHIAMLLGMLFAGFDRLFQPQTTPLANALGYINEHGIESLLIDPNSTKLPFSNRYLLVQRGATGYQYGDLCAGGAGGALPLGPTSDAPYAVNDVLMVRRLGARPGLELGIAVTGTAVTTDHLLASMANGQIQDISTVVGNGTYWIVGRAAAPTSATSSTGETTYVPMDPFQLVLTGSSWAYPTSVS